MSQQIADLANAVAADASLAALRAGVDAAVAKIAELEAENAKLSAANADLTAQLAAATSGTVPDAELDKLTSEISAALNPSAPTGSTVNTPTGDPSQTTGADVAPIAIPVTPSAS